MSHLTTPSRFSVRTISLVFLVSLTAMVGLIPWQPVERRASAQEPQSTSTYDEGLQEKLIPTANEPKPEVIGKDAEDPSVELTFADLKFDKEFDKAFERSLLPEKVKALEGKEITLSGYMRPSFKASGLSGFIFVRDIKENCFGPNAAIYDSVMVQMKKGTQTDYLARPLKIRGTFFLEERKGPDGKPWGIYNLKNTTIEPTLLDPETSKIQNRVDLSNELRRYQANFANRFDVAIAKRQKLDDEYDALRLAGGNIHSVMVVEIAKSIQKMRTERAELQYERSRNERARAAGPNAVETRVWEIQRNEKKERTKALEMRILDANADAELLRQKVGAGHPDFKAAVATVKILKQHLATLEKANAEPGTGDDGIKPEVVFARKNAEIERRIKHLSRSIVEQDEQWKAHNQEAIKLSKIQRQIKRLDLELEEIRASQRLGKELILQLMKEKLN